MRGEHDEEGVRRTPFYATGALIFHVRIERAGACAKRGWGEGEENRIGGESGAGEESNL